MASLRGCLLALLVLCSACSPRHLIVQGMASELASQGKADEQDLVLAREASAFYLKLSESLLREAPDNLGLAEAVAAGFTQYSFAFVQQEAERAESRDARAAQALRVRAARLYLRAHRHAMTALERRHPGFAKALAADVANTSLASHAAPNPAAPQLLAEDVPVAYWAAASWGALIALSKDDPFQVADLPQAVRLAQLAWARAPGHGEGALASLMGSLEAARPGGTRAQAQAYFDQALGFSAGRNAGVQVAMAESLAQPAGDRPGFEAHLREALQVSERHPGLANNVMAARAQWLLDQADDLF